MIQTNVNSYNVMKRNVASMASTVHNKTTVGILWDIKTAFDKLPNCKITKAKILYYLIN